MMTNCILISVTATTMNKYSSIAYNYIILCETIVAIVILQGILLKLCKIILEL